MPTQTLAQHRRKGLVAAMMGALDRMVERCGPSERLLVASDAGRNRRRSLGWRVLSPYATAVLLPERFP